MSVSESLVVIGMLTALLIASIVMFRAMFCLSRSENEPGVGFTYGWLGTYAMLLAIACCIGLAMVLGKRDPSILAIVTMLAVNLFAQPIALLSVWIAVRDCAFLVLELFHFTKRFVPEEFSAKREVLGWVIIIKVVCQLGMGVSISYGCAEPFWLWS
jgi:hypothetical protein